MNRFDLKRMRDALEQLEVPEGGSEDEHYTYTAGNGRIFELRFFEDGSHWFMSEMRPNGRVVHDIEREYPTDVRPDADLEALRDDPAAMHARIRERDLGDRAVMMGAGLGVDIRTFTELDDVLEAIHESIETNTWYDPIDYEAREQRHARENTTAGRIEALRSSRAYWSDVIEKLDTAMQREGGRYQGVHTMFGDLSRDARMRLNAFFAEPSFETWDEIHSLDLIGGETAWQIWTRYDRTAPRSLPGDGEPSERWPNFPSSAWLEQSIAAAADDRRLEAVQRIEAIDAEIEGLRHGEGDDDDDTPPLRPV